MARTPNQPATSTPDGVPLPAPQTRDSWKTLDPTVRFEVVDNRNERPIVLNEVKGNANWQFYWASRTNLGPMRSRGWRIATADCHVDHLGPYASHEFHIPSGSWRENESGWVENYEGQVLMALPKWLWEERQAQQRNQGWDAMERHARSGIGPRTESPDVEKNNYVQRIDPRDNSTDE